MKCRRCPSAGKRRFLSFPMGFLTGHGNTTTPAGPNTNFLDLI